jgi:hypothetical protein
MQDAQNRAGSETGEGDGRGASGGHGRSGGRGGRVYDPVFVFMLVAMVLAVASSVVLRTMAGPGIARASETSDPRADALPQVAAPAGLHGNAATAPGK